MTAVTKPAPSAPTTGHSRPGQQVLLVGDDRLTETSSGPAQQVLAAAYAQHVRPRCLCAPGRPEMYIARVGGSFIVKRMPESGAVHAAGCESYQPPQHLSGLGQVLGSAIDEQPEADKTALRLGFSLSKSDRAAPAAPDPDAPPADTVATDGTKLTLRAVLHYLWDEAGLATWSPRMSGKRTWRVVSWHLRKAADGKYVKGAPLGQRLFIPEPWTKDRAAQAKARWRQTTRAYAPASGKTTKLLLLVGEVKDIVPGRYSPRVVIKNLPDAVVSLPEDLHKRLRRRFGFELETWEADEDCHLMLAATCTISSAGAATLEEATLVVTDRNWLPIADPDEQVLVETAVDNQRRFTKSLRYNLRADALMASIVLTDTPTPTACYVLPAADQIDAVNELAGDTDTAAWTWVVDEDFPDLPARGNGSKRQPASEAPDLGTGSVSAPATDPPGEEAWGVGIPHAGEGQGIRYE